jgi:nucleoside-diphosphate-sugar epimerase
VAALGRPENRNRLPNQPIVINETQKWEESPLNSNYAKTKYRAELEVWRGIAEGLDAVMVNPSIVLGTGDWNRSSTQLFKYVNDEKRFYPGGLVNYVDVQDVVEAMFQLMNGTITDARFILNAGTIPYKDLLDQIAVVLDKRPPTTPVSPMLAEIAWRLEAVRSWITGKTPLITRETARSASGHYQFDGTKIMQLIDFQYRPLTGTLQQAAMAYRS